MTGGTRDRGEVGRMARGWVVRLSSGDMTDAEMQRLKGWLAESGVHRTAFETERRFWHELAELRDDFAPERFTAAPTGGWRVRWRLAAVGGALAACVALLLAWPAIGVAFLADFQSPVGAQRSVPLPDGSVVHLNTDSAIDVEFAADERRIELLQGEALFEVKADPGRPFRVIANDGETRAVGTAFNVRIDDARTHVLVTEGQVAVSSPAAVGLTVDVRAGEETRYRRGAAPHPPAPSRPGRSVPWRRGKIVIARMPLSAALAELDRYRHGRIVLLGGDADRPVSGVFDIGHIDEAVDALAATQGLEVYTVTPFLTLLR